MAEKKFVQYHYDPSKAAAILFSALFAISTILHIYQSLIRNRRLAWFMTPFLIGCGFETVGYAARIASSNDPEARNPYIVQTLLILLAPALMAATIYMILSRIIHLTDGQKYAIVRRNWLTTIFVSGDVLSIVAQAIGGVLITSSKGTAQEQKDRTNLGKNVILIGLWLQIVFFGFFVLVSCLFHFRGRHHFKQLPVGLGWQKHLFTLYAVSLLILIRSLFRVIEYIQGVEGYLYTHEVFLYVFDALLIFTAVAAMNAVHPADIARLLKERDALGNNSEMARLGSSAGEQETGYTGHV